VIDHEAQMRELAERFGYTLTSGRNGVVIAQRGGWRLFCLKCEADVS
jgi:hypothetical protein